FVEPRTVRDGDGDLFVEGQAYTGITIGHVDGSLAGFKVEIDWGDATGKSIGSISGSDVVGDHWYGSFGRLKVPARIYNDTKDARGHLVDSREFRITTGAYVDAPALGVTAAANPLNTVAGQALGGQVLATVTGGAHAVGVVEWGDGTLTEITRGAV